MSGHVSLPHPTLAYERALLTELRAQRAAAPDGPGARDAADALVTAFSGLVARLARSMAPEASGDHEFDDLWAEGIIGLCEAVERFDPARLNRFWAFAQWSVRLRMSGYLSQIQGPVRVPVDRLEQVAEYDEARQRLSNDLGRSPTAVELARHLRWSPRTIRGVEETPREAVPLREWQATAQQEPADDPFAPLDALFSSMALRRRMHQILTPQQMFVLTLRYGLDGSEPMRYDQIALRIARPFLADELRAGQVLHHKASICRERARTVGLDALRTMVQDKTCMLLLMEMAGLTARPPLPARQERETPHADN
jgi:RNA polymerase primary sigma factor